MSVGGAIIGVVMAGGQSSRMGKDKALVTLGENTLLDIAIQKLNALSLHAVKLSRNDNSYNSIQDLIPAKGPLSAIHAACATNPERDLLFLPVDLPFLTLDTLRALINSGVTSASHVSVTGNQFPLFLKNTPELVNTLEQQLKHGQNYSVKRFFDAINITYLAHSNSDELMNINSPEDLQKARMLL